MPKALPHVSTLTKSDVERLSRDGIRWYFKQMGNERPSWQKEVLMEGMKHVVEALEAGTEEKRTEVERTHGIVLPKPGETGYYMDNVTKPNETVEKQEKSGEDPTDRTNENQDKEKGGKKKEEDHRTKAWLEGLTFEEKEALRKAEARRRGMEKRKCTNCGNYARSKCEFMCCKKCCVENNNPCKIHVLQPPETTPKVAQIVKPNAKFVEEPRTINLSGTKSNKLRDLREVLEYYQKDMASIIQWRQELHRQTLEAEEDEADEAMERYLRNARWMKELMEPRLDLQPAEHATVAQIKSRFPMPKGQDAEEQPGTRSRGFREGFSDEFGKLLHQVEHAQDHDTLEQCTTEYAEITGHPLQLGPPTPWKKARLSPSPALAEPASTTPLHMPGSLGWAKVEDPSSEDTIAGFMRGRGTSRSIASL